MDKYQLRQTLEHIRKKILNQAEPESYPEKFSLSDTKDSQCFCNVSFDSGNSYVKKGIITILAPEDLSLKDVEYLQKLNRDLRAENLKKTMAYIKLEKEYQLMKDEIIDMRRKDEMHRQETCSVLKIALDEISLHQRCLSLYPEACTDNLADQKNHQQSPADLADRDRILEELSDLTIRYDNLQRLEAQGRRQVAIYEEKYDYFESVVDRSSNYLNEFKKKWNESIEKVESLRSEIVVWKNKCRKYEKILS